MGYLAILQIALEELMNKQQIETLQVIVALTGVAFFIFIAGVITGMVVCK